MSDDQGTVVLVSGGIDSVLAASLYPQAITLFVDYGQGYARQELAACDRLFPDLKDMIVFGKSPGRVGNYVPARNLMLACLALRWGSRIVLGGMADDNCADKTPAAFDDMSRILTAQAGRRIDVVSPFWNLTKFEAISHYLAGGGDPERLRQTFSCYDPHMGLRDPQQARCGECEACFRWSVALRAAGVDVPPPGEAMAIRYLQNLHTYHPARQWATLAGLRQPGREIVECDIDGTLTEAAGAVPVAHADKRPNTRAIEALRSHYDRGSWVILHTARPEVDRAVTAAWLGTFRVPHHALLMGKPPAAIRFDDLALPMVHSAMVVTP